MDKVEYPSFSGVCFRVSWDKGYPTREYYSYMPLKRGTRSFLKIERIRWDEEG